MDMIDKEEYKDKILECLYRVDENLEALEWTKDISVLAKEDKWGEKNWVAKMMLTKGMLQQIQENLRDLMDIEEE